MSKSTRCNIDTAWVSPYVYDPAYIINQQRNIIGGLLVRIEELETQQINNEIILNRMFNKIEELDYQVNKKTTKEEIPFE